MSFNRLAVNTLIKAAQEYPVPAFGGPLLNYKNVAIENINESNLEEVGSYLKKQLP